MAAMFNGRPVEYLFFDDQILRRLGVLANPDHLSEQARLVRSLLLDPTLTGEERLEECKRFCLRQSLLEADTTRWILVMLGAQGAQRFAISSIMQEHRSIKL